MNHTGNDGRCWRAPVSPVAVIALVMFTTTLSSNLPSPLYVLYQQRFAFSAATLTYIFSAYAVAVLVALVTVGRSSDRVGRKRVIVPALVLLVVSALVFMTADGTAALVAARAVQGLATGTLTAAATAALVELEPGHDRRRASYISTASFIAGAAFGPLLSGLLMQYAPWPGVLPFLVQLGLLAVALVLMRAVPETVHAVPGIRWRLQRLSVPAPIRRAFAAASCTLAASWAVAALYASLSPSIDRQLLHVPSHAVAGALLFVFSGLGGLAQGGLRHWPSQRTMVVGASALSAGIALVGLSLTVASVLVFGIGTLLAGVGGGLSFMGSLALLNDVAPRHRRAEVVAAYNIVGYVALTAPVIGVGLLADSVGLQRAAQAFAVAAVAVCGLALWLTATLPTALRRAHADDLIEPRPRRPCSAHEVSDGRTRSSQPECRPPLTAPAASGYCVRYPG